jgi:hypothetical protein
MGMSFQHGHVVLDGKLVKVAVRDGDRKTWVSRRIGALPGPHLKSVEAALFKALKKSPRRVWKKLEGNEEIAI